ncbi:MAG: leucine-rich repeat domain-containing protein [Bacteroidaceae bacterium]|nr:leucine-rich repeat domain-containing protein [Bacteroidaceae bacterium]
MRRIIVGVVALIISVATVGDVEAQGFLKNLGKAIEKEVVKEINNSKKKKKDTAQPKKESKSQNDNRVQEQSSSTSSKRKNSSKSSSQAISVSPKEVCYNPTILRDGPTGAEIEIDGINYMILVDQFSKKAYLSGVAESLKGKTTHVKVWGGIQYKGEVVPVVYIKAGAFRAETLTSIELPQNLQEIQEQAFFNSSLKKVVIYGSTWRIGAGAFAASQLESVEMREGVTRIEGNAFAGCWNLTTVRIPESIEKIDIHAFYDCKNLSTVYLPTSMKTIPAQIFVDCKSLTRYSIPSSVERIGERAFMGTGLESVLIPLNVKYIEEEAFAMCENLKKVTIPSTVEKIEQGAFEGCTGITDVYINVKFKDVRLLAEIFGPGSHLFTSYNLDECKAFHWTE